MGKCFDPQHHSKTMRAVRSRDTTHEVLLRNYLAEAGYADESDEADLPFNPDIVFCGPKVAIFMHGCFWHRHKDCRFAYDVSPASPNYASWQSKFLANQERDERQVAALLDLNWRVLIVWQCALNAKCRASAYLPEVLTWLYEGIQFAEIPQSPPLLKN